MRINALIDDVDVVERILKHPVPDIAHKKARYKTGLSIFGSGGVLCAVPIVQHSIRLK